MFRARGDAVLEREPGQKASTGYVALCCGVIAIAWSGLLVRWAQVSGLSSAFWRMLIASLVLWPIVLLRRRDMLRHMSTAEIGLALLGGVCFGGDVGLYNIAVLRTSVGTATLLGNNAPLVVVSLTWILSRRAPSGRFWVALAITLAGSWMVIGIDVEQSSRMATADLLAVGASICFGFYLLSTERLRRQCDALTLLAVSAASSCAVLLTAAVATHTSLHVPGATSWLALLGLGLVCQVGGYFALTYALGHVPAAAGSVTMLAVAPLTAVLAWAFFGDHLRGWQVAGGVLVLAGIGLVNRRAPQSTSS